MTTALFKLIGVIFSAGKRREFRLTLRRNQSHFIFVR
jgi:hypothetical protein